MIIFHSLIITGLITRISCIALWPLEKNLSCSQYHYQDLINLFNQCFAETHNTYLIKGDNEPIYLPADKQRAYHGIYFAYGYFSSALHECAHWFIAGKQRRQQIDYGYWYEPDGRTKVQQQLFEKVEVKPQAIEWILSVAAGYPFKVSVDNLNNEDINPQPFKQAIYQQVLIYAQCGLPARAERFRQALSQFYNTEKTINLTLFSTEHC
ncbi:diaminobutyrate-2-oxoglutarate aminotransferase [Zooshikella ganghwensis]|uniref:Diaminobutyrate-2-oxoglutarate aminotransferase n=1 Tax=Zooshikella ganghwensis TaxID=202772 RepID=A0A4P9VLN2_9GAMM|nr:diaminobutyrate-2-oxoglutarate aminotransferase [Zooshikella ganghwensis]